MKEKIDRFYYENIYENAKIIMGSVTKKDVVTSDGSIAILGDVKSKAIVQAAGNVIVMGSLEGSVYAGYPEDDKCYIAANQINAAHMQIGKVAGDVKVASKWSFRSRKGESEPYAVVVWEQELSGRATSEWTIKTFIRRFVVGDVFMVASGKGGVERRHCVPCLEANSHAWIRPLSCWIQTSTKEPRLIFSFGK